MTNRATEATERAESPYDVLVSLVGWAQLILAAPDLPEDIRSRFANNHRLTSAVLALVSFESRMVK